jgi:hypothetical protein
MKGDFKKKMNFKIIKPGILFLPFLVLVKPVPGFPGGWDWGFLIFHLA